MDIFITLFTQGWIYVIVYIYLFVMIWLESGKTISIFKKITALISIWILILFIGFRWETGTDWFPYKELFDTIQIDWTFLVNIYHFDLGYVFLNAIVRLFTDNYTLFLIVDSFIALYLLYRLVIKISPYPNLSVFLFYSAFMIAQFMGSNRRMIAMVFVLWAFYFFYEYKKKYFFGSILLAFLFHRSSLISLGIIFISRKIFTIKQTLIILSFSLLIGLFRLPVRFLELIGTMFSGLVGNPIIEKIVFYSESGDEHLVNSTGSLLISTVLAIIKRSVFLLFYFYVIRNNNIDKLTGYLYNIYIVGFAGYLLFIGSFFQIMSAFFALVEVILIGRMYIYTVKTFRIFALIVIGVYGFLQMINALYVYPDLYMPYIAFWENLER